MRWLCLRLGKTSSLVYAVLYAVKLLLGKKDKEGNNPRIMVCSKTITFLSKTWTTKFEQVLKATGSSYKYDKAHNIITVGSVEIYLIATEEPENIYGFDVCYCFEENTPITTSKGQVKIKDVKAGDYVLTTQGFKKIKRNIYQGVKDCIEVKIDGKKIICTPDHKFIDINNKEIEAGNLTKKDVLLHYASDTGSYKSVHIDSKSSYTIGTFPVYDLEVEDCHEFFANGVRVHNCVVDELDELPTGTAMEAVKSINDRVRQQIEGFRSPTLCFATTSQGLKGLYQTVLHFKKSGIGYVLMRARTCDNTYLPKDYVKNMYTIYNEKERECLLEGKFISIDSGLVFPDYNPEKNLLDYDLYETVRDEMTDETVYIGQDFNTFGNNAIAAVIIDKAVVLIKDYEFPDIRKAPQVFRYDFPTQRIVWIPDMTYKEHFGEFKKELKMHRINIAYRSCNPLVTDRNFAANKLFFTERLFVCPLCKDTENTLLTWQKDPKTGLPSKGGKGAPDHKGDCLGYIVHYLLSWRRELKDIYSVTLGRLYTKRREHGASAAELEASTSILKPEQIRPTLKLPDETPEA